MAEAARLMFESIRMVVKGPREKKEDKAKG
jgi:hypothetical protein